MNKEKLKELDDEGKICLTSVLNQTLGGSCAYSSSLSGPCDIIKIKKKIENRNQALSGVSICLL